MLLPMLCIVILASGLPGMGTATMYPVADISECSQWPTLLRLRRSPGIAYAASTQNRSVPGDKSVVLDVRLDAEAHVFPLDTTAKYADNLTGLTPVSSGTTLGSSAATGLPLR